MKEANFSTHTIETNPDGTTYKLIRGCWNCVQTRKSREQWREGQAAYERAKSDAFKKAARDAANQIQSERERAMKQTSDRASAGFIAHDKKILPAF